MESGAPLITRERAGGSGQVPGGMLALAHVLSWWRDAGVDCLVAPAPRPWTMLSPAPEEVRAEAPRIPAGVHAHTPRHEESPLLVARPPEAPHPEVPAPRFATLADLHAHVAATAPGAPLADGNPASGLLVLGEAPSAEDLRTGRPFTGPAGRLLDRMLAAIGLDRSQAYITLLAPRLGAPGPPSEAAVAADLPLTLEHLRLAAPRLILLLGAIPTRVLTGDGTPISRMRGRVTSVRVGGLEVAALPTYNPAFLLRQPAAKREAWSDLLQLKAILVKAGLVMTGTDG